MAEPTDDKFKINLTNEAGRLEIATQLFQRFCEDLMHEGDGKARTRLISGIQVALRDAAQGDKTEPLFYYRTDNQK